MEPRSTHLACGAAILGIFGMLLASCGGPPGKSDAGRDGAGETGTPVPIALAVELDSGTYAIGEPIKMKLIAVNRTGAPLVLQFPTAQRFDFVVTTAGKPVWQWSADRMFAEALGTETLAPGDSLVYEAEWDQTLADGTNPGLGAYTIRGVLKAVPEIASREKSFGVVD